MSGVRQRVVVEPRARREVRDVLAWYHAQDPRAAVEFGRAFEAALVVLAEAPLRWAEVAAKVRRFMMPRHPYKLYYKVEDAQITILTVVHHARHPDIWRRGP